MTDLTVDEISTLFKGAVKKAPFDADSVTKDVAADLRQHCQTEIDIHARLLQQRQVIALERIAEAVAGNPERAGLVDALYDIGSRR